MLIDGDNIPSHYSEALVNIAKKRGRLVFARAYINGSTSCDKWKLAKDVDVFISAVHSNASDFRLSFEAVYLEALGGCDRFIIASNDSDLSHVVRWLTGKGRRVTVVGTDKMSDRMRSVTDDPVVLQSKKVTPPTVSAPSDKEINRHIIRLIRSSTGAVPLVQLGGHMRSVHGITRKDIGEKGWMRYLMGREDLFTLTGEAHTMAVITTPLADALDDRQSGQEKTFSS